MPDTAIAPVAVPSSAPTAAAEAAPIAAPVAAPAETLTEPTAAEALATLDLTKFTDSQVKELESGDPERIGKVLKGSAPAVKAEAAAKPAGAIPEVPEHTDNGESKARISIKSLKPEDRVRMVSAMEAVRNGKSPTEALSAAFGITAPPVAVAVAPPALVELPAPAVPQVHPKVAALELSLAALKQQYKDEKAAYDPAAVDTLEKVAEASMDLQWAKRDAVAETERQAAHAIFAADWEAQQAIHGARALDMFSELMTDPDSRFNEYASDELLLAEAKKDPILLQPDWQEKIGQRVIEKFFKGKAANSAEPKTGDSPIPPAPKTSVRLPGSPTGNGYSSGGPSLEAAEAEFNALPWEDRIAALGKIEAAAAANRR